MNEEEQDRTRDPLAASWLIAPIEAETPDFLSVCLHRLCEANFCSHEQASECSNPKRAFQDKAVKSKEVNWRDLDPGYAAKEQGRNQRWRICTTCLLQGKYERWEKADKRRAQKSSKTTQRQANGKRRWTRALGVRLEHGGVQAAWRGGIN